MLFSLAHAADGAPADPMSGLTQFLPLIVIFVLFYFMMIRPQMKRAKEQKNMIDSLQKGDEVVTAGGELGKVVKVSEAYIGLEVADGVVINVQKSAVTTLLPKGTIKGI
ncbi:MAG: preprotein translocase subunit YajC [Sulfuricella sp.]|nr:preprotein translocase subunit YajC [Sulfuricella sp.]